MAKKKQELAVQSEIPIDEAALFQHISEIIENRKARAGAYVNREIALMYWEVGIHINSVILDGGRASYGKNILATLSIKLMEVYGNSFYVENIYRMMRFAKVFNDFEILSTASTKLSWSHFCEIMRVKTEEGRIFYANDAVERNLGVHALRKEISRKAFERREIANTQLSEISKVPFNTFKDPFLLDARGNLRKRFGFYVVGNSSYIFIERTPQKSDKLLRGFFHFLETLLSFSSSRVAKAFASCSVVMSK